MTRTMVVTSIPYPLIWHEGKLEIRVRDELISVQFQRVWRQQEDHTSAYGVAQAQGMELLYDRLGRVASTELRMLFPRHISDPRELADLMLSVVNRLIDVYRLTMDEFFLESIPRNEVRIAENFAVGEDGSESPESSVTFDFGAGITIARTSPIPQEAVSLLQSGAELPIPEMLTLNARREYLLENFRLAVVEEETAFEALIDEVVSVHYASHGRSPTEIENILTAGLKNLLADHIPRCCEESFVDTAAYAEWSDHLYARRNAIVHEGATVSKDEADRALKAGNRAIEWVKERSTRRS